MRREIRPHGELARVAGGQHGVISRAQLEELGYSDASVARAVRSGRLHRVFRGAYAVGHPGLGLHGRCLAAVLSCGEGALLSHWSSAWLLGLSGSCPHEPHVTVPQRGHRRSSIQIHHSTIIEDEDRVKAEGIPATSTERTLLDLATRARRRKLANLVDRCERLGALDIASLDSLLARSGGHPGRATLARALDIYRDPAFSRARSERLFLALVKKAGLPRPATNLFIAGHEIDAYWEQEKFAVEVDGWGAHRTRVAFERDPRRIEDLKLAGIDAIRITARRIEREPEAVAKRLATFLAQRHKALGLDPARSAISESRS